jgi:plasmid replication initiation protein
MKNEKSVVIKSNVLLEGRYSFTLLEMKMLLLVIAQIKRQDVDFHPYRIFISDLQDAIKIKGKQYGYLRKVAESLKEKSLTIETVTGHLVTSYISDIELFRGKGFIDFYISPKLKPYLLQLNKNFTMYDIRNVLNCKSVYSIRIYQLMKQFEKLGSRAIPVDELRKMLGLQEDQYGRWMNFKTRILEVARKELKRDSDLYFEYTLNKQGRVVQAITFTIKKQRQRRLFDGEDYIKNDAVVSYQKPADETLKRLEEAGKDAVPMPDNLREKLDG